MNKKLRRNTGYIKLRSTGRVLGMFYRHLGDKTQYITFHSTVVSIESAKVEPAAPEEVEESRRKRMERQERQLSSEDTSDTSTQAELNFSSDSFIGKENLDANND